MKRTSFLSCSVGRVDGVFFFGFGEGGRGAISLFARESNGAGVGQSNTDVGESGREGSGGRQAEVSFVSNWTECFVFEASAGENAG